MIQELLGNTSALLGAGGDNKISMNGGILEGTPCPTTTNNNSNTIPTTRVSNTNGTSSTTTTPSNSEGQNLRCPRCDSTNTKFCYYNNYNLTQPRHFCKTCRRYWTKGGALRNVPIGGGCRKNKNSASANIPSSIGKALSTSTVGKLKTFSSHDQFGIIQGLPTGFDNHHHHHEFHPSNGGIVWASPQNSHILALLRAAQNSNSNHSCMSNVKDEGGSMMMSHLINSTNQETTTGNGVLNARTLGLDALSPTPSLALNSTSVWSNDQNQNQSRPSSQNGFTLGDNIQNSGLQELYQRLRTSSANYTNEQCPNILDNNMGSAAALTSSSSSSTSILESAPVAATDLSYRWNPAFSWSDLPTTNGAYP